MAASDSTAQRSEPQYSNVAAHHFVRALCNCTCWPCGPLSNRCACRWEFAEEQPEDETIRAELGEVETESGSSDPTNFDFYSHQQVRFRKAHRCTVLKSKSNSFTKADCG
jgi:hypothetical protein